MFKKILLSAFLAFSANVAAQEYVYLPNPVEYVYLPNPVAEQTGLYYVQGDYITSFGQFIEKTGVSLEIVEPGNRLSPFGPTSEQIFVFGAFFDSRGRYFVFSGFHQEGRSVPVAISRVEEDGTVLTIGEGHITVDPLMRGDAHNIGFTFEFYNPETLFTNISGTLVKSTDNLIDRCKLGLYFPPQPTLDVPCAPPSQQNLLIPKD